MIDDTEIPEDRERHAEDLRRLDEEIARLPTDQRNAVVAVYGRDTRQKVAAAELGISEATLRGAAGPGSKTVAATTRDNPCRRSGQLAAGARSIGTSDCSTSFSNFPNRLATRYRHVAIGIGQSTRIQNPDSYDDQRDTRNQPSRLGGPVSGRRHLLEPQRPGALTAAGCGNGSASLGVAASRPEWSVRDARFTCRIVYNRFADLARTIHRSPAPRISIGRSDGATALVAGT